MTDFNTAMADHFSHGVWEKNADDGFLTSPVISPSDPQNASPIANVMRTVTPLNVLLTAAGGIGGGLLMRDRARRTKARPGETEEERRERINRAAIQGGLLGAAIPAGALSTATFMSNVQPDYGRNLLGTAAANTLLGGAGAIGGYGTYAGLVGGAEKQHQKWRQRAARILGDRPGQVFANPKEWTKRVLDQVRKAPTSMEEFTRANRLLTPDGRPIMNATQFAKHYPKTNVWRYLTGGARSIPEQIAALQRYGGVDNVRVPKGRIGAPFGNMVRPVGGGRFTGMPTPRGRGAAAILAALASIYGGNATYNWAQRQGHFS